MLGDARKHRRDRSAACVGKMLDAKEKWRASISLVVILLSGCVNHENPQLGLDRATETFQRGDLSRALELTERGSHQYKGAGGEWAEKFITLEANILLWQGSSDRALEVLELDEPVSGELIVQKLRLQGLAYSATNKPKEAERSLKEAERLCAMSAYPACTLVVSARAGAEMQSSHFERAQLLFNEVRLRSMERGDRFVEASALMNLCWAHDEQAQFDEVVDACEAALQISNPLGFRLVAEAASGNLAWAYYKLGEAEKAGNLFAAAAKEAAALGGRADQIKWITNVGFIALDAGRNSEAEAAFRQALSLASEIRSREDVVNSLIALAFASEQNNNLNDAQRYSSEALSKAREDKNGRDVVYPRLVQGRIAARLHDTVAAEAAFHEVDNSPDTPDFLKWEAERSLARLYEDESHPKAALREYRAAIQTFETARSATKHEDTRLPFLSNATHIYDDYIHFLIAQGKQDEALQVAASSRGRTLDEGLGQPDTGQTNSGQPDSVHANKNQSRKKEEAKLDAPALARRFGGTILFYWLGQKQSYLWTITPQKATLLPPLPPGAEIDAAVQRYRKTLIHGPGDVLASADSDGEYLFRTLIAPAQSLLKKDAKVLIIPDASLNNLNFETLLVTQPSTSQASAPSNASSPQAKPHYWLEDVTIVNGSSLRIRGGAHAPQSAAQSKPDRSLLLIGNSVAPNDQYPTLPQAATQMQSVAQRFPSDKETILAQQEATPGAYLASNPERFNYIHFVAHGESRRLSPLDSFIVLSKAGAEEESFKLYARQIIAYHKAHPLHAELVTVSACYSAGERAYSGEGLVGLSWAFLHAGAHNVIAALWDATDAPTQQLMDKFYDELNKGATPAAALRSAKLYLLHQTQFSSPLYWAPFQLYSRL